MAIIGKKDTDHAGAAKVKSTGQVNAQVNAAQAKPAAATTTKPTVNAAVNTGVQQAAVAPAQQQAQTAAKAQQIAQTNPSNATTPTADGNPEFAAAERSQDVFTDGSTDPYAGLSGDSRAQLVSREQQARQQAQQAAKAQQIAEANPTNDVARTKQTTAQALAEAEQQRQTAARQEVVDYDRQQQMEYEAWLAKQPAYVPPEPEPELEPEPEPEPEPKTDDETSPTPKKVPDNGNAGTDNSGAGARVTGITGESGTGFSLTPEQIKELQERYMGVMPTGVWDENTIARANGQSMEEWWNGYQAGLAWDFGPNGNPSEEARRWAAQNAPRDYARWLVQRGEAPNMSTAVQIINNMGAKAPTGAGNAAGGYSYDTGGNPGTGVYTASYGGNSGAIGPIEAQTPDWQPLLDQWRSAAEQQAQNQTDYATERGVTELQRAEEDAQSQFQAERDQAAAAAAKALDNQALYAERRGDRGGIGMAQYNEIQNAAAQNQLAINQAQTKLSTDTARQIADLRAQGEYQKADQLLQIAQQYLSQLINLQQWNAEYGLNVAQFNKQLEKWNLEFEADVASLTGTYRGQPTIAMLGNYAEAGLAAAQAGIQPSEAQLQAIEQLYGYDRNAILGMVQTALLGAESGLGGGYRYTGNPTNPGSDVLSREQIAALQEYLGAGADGVWGPESQQKAKARGWSTDLNEAWDRYVSEYQMQVENYMRDEALWNDLAQQYNYDVWQAQHPYASVGSAGRNNLRTDAKAQGYALRGMAENGLLGDSVPLFSTRTDAVKFAGNHGVPNAYTSYIKDRGVWESGKAADPRGEKDPWNAFESYGLYLQAFVSYLINTYAGR